MRLRTMTNRDDLVIAPAAALFAWASSHVVAVWVTFPSWLRSLGQLLFTVLCGLATLTAQHYWREFFLNRRRQKKAKAEE